MSFDNLGLKKELLQATEEQGYTQPSPIQLKAIPAVLEGRDVMAAAQTGTGKTAAFTLPILQRLSTGVAARPNQARALILTPTRELAAQIDANVSDYGRYLRLRSTVVFGGVKINPQMMQLRKGADILVATPGRLLDLYNQNAVRFQQLEILVLDEADRMLDMGFIHDIRKILKVLPAKRQNLLFSATFSKEIRSLAKTIVDNPLEISVSPPNSTVEKVEQWLVPVDKTRKSALLTHLIKKNDWYQLLVFSRTKHGANRIATQLNKQGIEAAAIHGNKSQGARTRALASFKTGDVQVLVATDIAARGIDIDQLPYVVNFDLPNVPEDYVHRIGRTARAGAEGKAVSLVSADEHKSLVDIERLIKQEVERRYEEGFEPDQVVPSSSARPVSVPGTANNKRRPQRSAASRTANKQGGQGQQQRKKSSRQGVPNSSSGNRRRSAGAD